MPIKILKKVAEKNVKVVTKKGSEPEKVVKEGMPLDHALKHDPLDLKEKIGMSKGVTVNLGDYQSVRVDCWLTTSQENGENIQQTYNRISEIITDRIALEVTQVRNEL